MAYIGLVPQTKFLATSTEKLSGTGVDYEYSLNRSVSKAADLTVFVGNTAQVPEVDYTASGTQLLFTTQPASGTDNIVVNYSAGALTSVDLTSNSFPQGSTTAPSIRYVDGVTTGFWFPSTTSIGLTTSGNTRVKISDEGAAVDAASGALSVTGGLGVSQNIISGGAVTILDTSVSNDTTTGALVVYGGLGVGGELSVGGGITVAGDFTVAGAFTTTSSDSLTINDPFLFLANTNAGDALDTGFVSSYVVDSATKYTGFFRDVTDGRYRLFTELDTQPTTTVDTGDASFTLADLVLGSANITATTASTTSATGALIVGGGAGVYGAISVNAADNATAIINSGTTGVGNIGASGATFNTAFLKATSAQYADVAERYTADAAYEPGTVLVFGGIQEVTQCTSDSSTQVAGVVSTNPAYIMNDALQAEHVATVALLGRVPTKVQGQVAKGDMLVSAGNGRARAEANPRVGSVIGKALENFDGLEGVIEVVIGRN